MVEDKKLLIAGIDNGATKSYALLDLDGQLIRVSSSKKFTLASITKEISEEGRVVRIGSDVSRCPQFVKKIATSLNSDIYTPRENILIKKKNQLSSDYLRERKLRDKIKLKDHHQRDALAAAILTLKSMNPLLNKINNHLKQNNLQYISEEVIEKVIIEKIPISQAVGS
mgnify:CR=1 FL=1